MKRTCAKKLTDGTVLLYMRYFGVRPFTDEFLLSLRESVRGITLIEDRTHDVIVPRGEERFAPDAVLASLRKWAALPEGGMLRTGMGSCQQMQTRASAIRGARSWR